MIVYHGWRDHDGTLHVDANGEALPLRLDLENHSPTGFEIGYGGSGPAQLALALLAHAIGQVNRRSGDRRAVKLHQQFKWKAITPLPYDQEFWFTDPQIRAIANQLESDREDRDEGRSEEGLRR